MQQRNFQKNHNADLIDEKNLPKAIDYLAKIDRELASVVEQLGQPPLWHRDEGFSTLVHIILEQQVSLASALAAYEKLKALAGPLNPVSFLRLNDFQLKSIGFSRQKTAYCRNLAGAIIEGKLPLEKLAKMDDETVTEKLTDIKGIGPWTAKIYLLMAMKRPDIFPAGDLALVLAIQRLKKLSGRPEYEEMSAYFDKWRPWRSVAARILWHYYLSLKN